MEGEDGSFETAFRDRHGLEKYGGVVYVYGESLFCHAQFFFLKDLWRDVCVLLGIAFF